MIQENLLGTSKHRCTTRARHVADPRFRKALDRFVVGKSRRSQGFSPHAACILRTVAFDQELNKGNRKNGKQSAPRKVLRRKSGCAPTSKGWRRYAYHLAIANSLYNLGHEYESHSAGFEPRDCFHECGNRCRMRMADGDGKSVTRGIARGEINLRENRVAICRVVEKYFARCRPDSRPLGSIVGHRRSRRAAIHEK